MRGFGGRHLRHLLRASVPHRPSAGPSSTVQQSLTALRSRAAVGQHISRSLLKDAPGLSMETFGLRGLRCSSILLESVNVEVASFGESITEGSIAGILKQPGEGVETDEVLFQIETDKVTIDVRAPQSGTLEEILVKEDDTVKVGDVLAKIKAGEAPAQPTEKDSCDPKQEDAGAGAAPVESTAVDKETQGDSGAAAEAAKEPVSQAEADKDGAAAEAAKEPVAQVEADKEAESAPSPHRKPGIKFPTRRTPEGKQITMLSIEEQQRFKEKMQSAGDKPQAAPQQAAPSTEDQKGTVVTSGPWYAGTERGTKLSQSRVLSEREMEMIELGGASD